MTTEEFNDKYEGWLEKDHYGLDIYIPSVVEYLDRLFELLVKIEGFSYSQIKLKFNTARFYSKGLPKGWDTVIERQIDQLVKEHDNG